MLSAAEAVGPAWERTKEVLFEHRSWRLYFKLSAVATLAALGNGFNFNLNVPARTLNNSGNAGHAAAAMIAAAAAAFFLIFLIALAIFLVLFYAGSRMQFVLIDVVARRETVIRPLWDRYGAPTWKWIGVKVALFLAMLAVVAALMAPFLFAIFRQAKKGPQSQMSAGAALSLFGAIALLFVVIVAFFAILYLLRDFVLPVMALENAPLGEGVRRLRLMLRHEPGQMLLYLFLRFILGIMLGIAAIIVLILGMAIVGVPVVGGCWALWHTIAAHGSAGAKILVVAACIVGGLVTLGWTVFVYICSAGFVTTFFQAYALYFFAGRYPLLGEVLEPSGQSWWNLPPSEPFNPPSTAPEP